MTIGANQASIIIPNIRASNGYVQIPDRVLINYNVTLLDSVESLQYRFSNEITKFRRLVQTSGLASILQQFFDYGLTLFVPIDSAFDQLGANLTTALFQTPDEAFITDLLLYHFLPINVYGLKIDEHAFLMHNNVSAWLTNGGELNNLTFINSAATLNFFYAANGYVFADEAYKSNDSELTFDWLFVCTFSNMYLIDQVLVPPNIGELLQITSNVTTGFNTTTFTDIVQDHADLSYLLNGMVAGNIFNSNNYLTVFAPVQSAFDQISGKFLNQLLEPIWLMHLQSLCYNHFSLDIVVNTKGPHPLAMLSNVTLTLDVITPSDSNTAANLTIGGVTVEQVTGSNPSFLATSDA
jgi:uncharacterized surface protein with fasciclin (FAS1) repeats